MIAQELKYKKVHGLHEAINKRHVPKNRKIGSMFQKIFRLGANPNPNPKFRPLATRFPNLTKNFYKIINW